MQKLRQNPILILLAINILIGLFTFQSYGLSWDEPLFYDYANALGYAYSPREWFSGDFNLELAYGSSPSDHANRSPAYLLLARQPVRLLEFSGLDPASAWHLVNFLAFQLGIYLIYRISKRWMSEPAALASAAFLAWQPLLWGHAFINPKDPPFLVFFLGAMCFGFEMVDAIAKDAGDKTKKIILAALFLGIATSIRVLGPLAGLLVCIYGLTRLQKNLIRIWIKSVAIYAGITFVIMYVTWPYLWFAPIQRFFEAFGFMSDNPTRLMVLFSGNMYHADQLPGSYLPVLLTITLTEPVWPLSLAGMAMVFRRYHASVRKSLSDFLHQTVEYWLLLLWFIVPFAYVLIRRPPMYDGFRHFLFILPPVFIFAGFAFEKLLAWVRPRWTSFLFLAVVFMPSLIGISRLHPYQYAYYNSFVGGTGGAFREFETDYWLTCYKEAIEEFQESGVGAATIYINREGYIAQTYADDQPAVRELRGSMGMVVSGDYILVNTRGNEDRATFRDAPIVQVVERAGAWFCVIKQNP